MTTGTIARNHGCFEGVRRVRLQYRTWEVPKPRAAVLLIHGFSDHSGRYDPVGEALAALGLSSFALDLRGHGRSDGRRGHVARFRIFLQEVDRFRREVQGLVEPDCPLFLLGHSMGGLIALRYLEEFETPFRGAVISAPWLGTAAAVPRWKLALAAVFDRILPALPVPAGIRAEDLCHDPAVVAAYRDDPLVHDTMTPRLFKEASAAMDLVFRRGDRLRTPLLFLVPGDDRVVSSERTLRFARGLDGDVTIRVYDGRYHELFFEPDRDRVLDDLRRWLDERLG